MPALAIIIVSWNVRDLLRRCLTAIEHSLAGSTLTAEIVVVDNASSDGTAAMVRRDFAHVRLLEPGINLGFAGGNNLALRSLGFAHPTPTHDHQHTTLPFAVLLLNPDTEPVGDALPRLVYALQQNPQLVAVGPRLHYGDGTLQSSRRRFPTRLTFFWESTPLERCWPGNPWARRYHCADQDDTTAQPVDWLVGAALLVRGSAIQRAGLLDERFFLYSEELEWQHRLQAAHPLHPSAIRYVPDALVVHHEGRSSEQVPAGRHIHFHTSRLRLAQMWYGCGFAAVLRGFLLACYGWELAVESGKHLLHHRRALRRQRIGVYIRVMQALLAPLPAPGTPQPEAETPIATQGGLTTHVTR
jgi:GT2 family glycosyltransferase